MNERPILFSGEMVRAIITGRKTQTRRVIKAPRWSIPEYAGVEFGCPYGRPRDRLWVKETWAVGIMLGGGVSYKASGHHPADGEKWRPSIHMPRCASRITLEITGVRVERVQDISEVDAKAEGAEVFEWRGDPDQSGQGWVGVSQFQKAFNELWDSINAKRGFGWNKNPWVWAIEFKRTTEGGMP